MIPALRLDFNKRFAAAKYREFEREMAERCGTPVKFRLCETPCFFPKSLLDQMSQAGSELILQLTNNTEYHRVSDSSIPTAFLVPNEPDHPMFVQWVFGLVRDADGQLRPKLVELQAFPSLYAYQPVLSQTYIDVFVLDSNLRYHLSGLNSESYAQLLRDAIVAGHDPANVVLMEVHPEEQKTLPDFLLTEKLLGVRTVCITKIHKEGRRLFYEAGGQRIPIQRIYNRAIVDELERKGVALPFDFRDDLDVEWAGHPNWYFRISKYSIPYLHHPAVPPAVFLNDWYEGKGSLLLPEDREQWVFKPLYSFAGKGVQFGPTDAELSSIPQAQRHNFLLQQR